MRCLVTGGIGFLGSHMTNRLRAEGHHVITLDDASTRAGMMDYRHDIRQSLPNLGPLDWVFHFAGLAAIPPSMEAPAKYMAVNAQGTSHVLEAARRSQASRFIYAASGTCYGLHPPSPTKESDPIICETPYALSKWVGEEMVMHWDRTFDLPSVSLRLFNPYGPGMSPKTSGMGYFVDLRRQGRPLTITGDGQQVRDWHYVDDSVEAFLLAAKSSVRNIAMNIGSGNPQSINRLADLLGGERVYTPARREALGTHADISRAKSVLGWEPRVSFEDGVARTIGA